MFSKCSFNFFEQCSLLTCYMWLNSGINFLHFVVITAVCLCKKVYVCSHVVKLSDYTECRKNGQ